MANKAERGTKRVCGSCEAKFYDLNKDPITCPLCGTVFAAEVVVAKAPAAPSRKVEKPAVVAEEASTEAEPDTVSLEEVAASEEADIDINDDVLVPIEDDDEDVPVGEDDDTFLETDDEGNDDVSDIVGGPIAKEDDVP